MNDGRIVERDELGRITKTFLGSDVARAMVANRVTKADKQADSSAIILAEMGYTDGTPAPEVVKNLAEIAASQKTGAVSAIGTLLRIAHGDSGNVQILKPGDTCPTCGGVVSIGSNLARELVEKLLVTSYKDAQKSRATHGEVSIRTA